jgi:outer membrane lipoprotein-sorting protein
MKFKVALLAPLLLAGTLYAAAPLTPASSADDILDALHDRGADLKDFTANVTLREIDNDTGLASARSGHVAYQLKSPGEARLHVVFDTKQEENGPAKPQKIEYLLDNGWLVDRDYQRRTETRRQVLRPGEKVNLLKLGEGPFPLPIGQEKADVYRMFDVSQPKPEADAPNLPHVTLTPKAGTKLARRWSSIDVWVDPATNMPTRISTVDANKTTTRETELSNIQINTGANGGEFTLAPVDPATWSLREEPYSD